MMKSFFIIVSQLILPTTLLAAGSGDGSIFDLKFAVVNSVIFFGILYKALKTPLKNYFKNNSEEISSVFNRAQTKAKEAKLRLEMFEKKLNDSELEAQKIIDQAKKDSTALELERKAELGVRTQKMKEEAKIRMELERSASLNQLNKNLVEEVVEKARSMVSSDKKNQNGFSKKLLGELR